jgi:acyl carrier protein
MSNDIKTRVIKLVASQLDIDPGKIRPNSSFEADLGADSLDRVELVMALEEEFKVEIPDNAAEKITKVEDAVNFIEEQLKGS